MNFTFLIPDLRKLIKYDERLASYSKEDYFSSLHKRDTVSSRAKLGDRDTDKENVPQERLSGGSKDRPSSDKGLDTLNLASLLQDKLSIDATNKSTKESDCKRRSRSKTRKHPKHMTRGLSSDESDPNQGRNVATRSSKVRRSSCPRSAGRFSALGMTVTAVL